MRRYAFEALLDNEFHGAEHFFFTPYAQKGIPKVRCLCAALPAHVYKELITMHMHVTPSAATAPSYEVCASGPLANRCSGARYKPGFD